MKKKTVKKMRRLLATLLAFTLTFSLASTDVLAAGVAMAQETAFEEPAVSDAASSGEEAIVDDGASGGEEAIADDDSSAGEEVTGEEALEAEATGESESAAESKSAGEIDEQAEVKTVAEGELAEKSEAAGETKVTDETKAIEPTEDAKDAEEVKATEATEETKSSDEIKATEAAEESKLAEEAKVAETTENAEEPEETKATEEISAPAETEETGETTAEEGVEEGTGKAGLRTRSLLRSSGLSGTIISEGFEDGIPEGWTLEGDTEGYNWTTTNDNYHSGSKSAFMKFRSGDGQTAWLITPAYDFSSVTGVMKLSFWYLNKIYSNKFEELSVCYRVDGGEWQELFKTAKGTGAWAKQILILPEGAKSANVELGFCGTNHDALSVLLDDVLLEIVESVQTHSVTYNANGGSGSMTDPNSPYVDGSIVAVLPNAFQAPTGKAFSFWNTKADGSGTTYQKGNEIEIDEEITLYAQWRTLSGFFDEDFEVGSIPAGWISEDGPSNYHWEVGTGDSSLTTGAHSGVQNALIKHKEKGAVSWLITPELDLRSVTGTPKLSFWLVNRKWQSELDKLGVYYRINGGEWKELIYVEDALEAWTEMTLYLPNEVKTTGVQIGFKALDGWGYGIGLDDVVIEDGGDVATYAVTYNANGGSGSMTDPASPYFVGTNVKVLGNAFTAPAGKGFSSWNVEADGSGTSYQPGDVVKITGNVTLYAQWAQGCVVTYDANGGSGSMSDPNSPYLSGSKATVLSNGFTAPAGKKFVSWNTKADGSGTACSSGDQITVNEDVTLYAQWKNLKGILDEDFEEGTIPNGWAMESDREGFDWMVYQFSSSHSGEYGAVMYYAVAGSNGENIWLISPALNLSEVAGILKLSFWYKNPPYGSNVDELRVCWRIDGGEWQELFATEGSVSEWTQQILALPEEAKTANVQIGFWGINHDGYYIYLDDVLLEGTSDAQVYAVTYNANGGSGSMTDNASPYFSGNKVKVLENSFTAPAGKVFSAWNTKVDGSGTSYAPGDKLEITQNVMLYAQWGYAISISETITGGSVIADKTAALAGETVTLTVTPYESNLLEELTVKRGSESVALTKTDDGTYTFVMPEGNVTVEATFNLPSGVVFYEMFEGGELPAGWTFTDSDGDTYGWNIKEVSQDKYGNPNSHSGSYVLTSESYNNDVGALTPDNWAITPAITIPENAVLSFWIKAQDPNYPGDKMAVYVGLSPNVDAMTKVGGDYEAHETFEHYLVDLSAYEGQTVYVAFRHYDISDLFWLNLDDVMVFGDGEGNIYHVTYDANGGSGEMTDPNMYFGGTGATVLPCEFAAPAGTEFMGWNTKEDGSGTLYTVGDVMVMSADFTLYAQWVNQSDLATFLEEGFEGGVMPEGWTVTSDTAGYAWAVTSQTGSHVGDYNATISHKTEGAVGWLITPALNLSGISGAVKLRLCYENRNYSGDTDEFAVCYRVDGGEWTELFSTKTAHDMVYREIFLPQEAKAANVEFGFKAIDRYGYGVSIDEISIKGIGEVISTVCAVTYDANGGSGETVDLSSPYANGETATVMPNCFTAPQGMRFVSWNTKADGSGTTYLPASTFEITKSMTLYAQWENIPPMPIQLTEGFEGGSIPQGWKSSTLNYHWIVGTGDHTEVTGAHSGSKNALIAHVAKGMSSWLITPELDLRYGADYVLSFWYINRAWGSDVDSLKVCYRVNGGEWVELFSTSEAHQTWTKQEIKVPEEAKQAGVEFGFQATDGYGYYVGLDDVQVRLYGNPVYKVTVGATEHGTVNVDAVYVERGEGVPVNFSPESGYKLAEINLDVNGTCPQISEYYAGHYAFTMPEADVTVNVKFVETSATYEYGLWVAGTRVTSANASDVLGDGAASYDGITKTLTLNKNITCSSDDAIYGTTDGLVIRTTAPLMIVSTKDDGIQLTGDTTIETTGLLRVIGATDKGGYGIYGLSNDIVIRHAQIVVSGKWGIYGGNGPVEIRDSFITASGTYGAAKYVTLSGCQVVGPAGTTFGNDGVIRNADATVALKATISHVTEITKENPYVEGFEESGLPDRWLFIERDGDGELWFKPGSEDAIPHSGEGVLSSASYLSGVGGLAPDNWAFTEALRIPENAELSFWIRGQADRWSTEKLEVYVGYGPDDEDLTKVGEYVSNAEYKEYKVDLSEYAGQAVFIGFRHCDTENQYWLNLDDVTVRVGKLTDENLAVTKKTLTLFDTISIDFKVPAEAVEGYHDPYLMVTQNGEETKLTTYREDGGFLIFSYRVPPQAMGDVATAVPH
ncbi:MAG: choice-of-anchor J domain-containing protein, partial [Lachnospiraceae bacterium]|nr:choice-of-anchor J domain-containing protein [Lachnospiraceae bacterium]